MQLNGIECTGYGAEGERLEVELTGCTLVEALALDGQTLTVTVDGEEAASFAGYAVTAVESSGKGVRMTCARKLSDATQAAIESLETSVAALSGRVGNVEASTGPQFAALAAIAAPVLAPSMTDSQAARVSGLFGEWTAGTGYAKGQVVRCDGSLYRIAQAHTSQEQWRPGTAGLESLYTAIDLAPDGLRVWHAPTGATDAFEDGERAHYPDADGPVYVSRRDGNTSVPGADEWWTVEG